MKNKTVYLNWQGPKGKETIDAFSPEPNQTSKDFRKYVREMANEYTMAGMAVYQSSRPCANWKE